MSGLTGYSRILTLDLIRGYLLFVIIIDHLLRVPGLYDLFTGRGELWVSAAEGFFLISGLLVGLIYGRNSQSLPRVLSKLWSRAGKLYLCSVGLTLLFTVWGRLLPFADINSGLWTGPVNFNFFFSLLTLRYIYGWANFLAYYVFFLLFSPLVIFFLRRGLFWLPVIVSFVLWVFGRSSIYLSWQILFFLGLVLGYYFPRLETVYLAWPELLRRRFFRSLLGITLLTFAIGTFNIYHKFSPPLLPALFTKIPLGPGRLLLALVFFITAYLLVRPREQAINKLTAGFFQILGRNSLFVYGLHAVIIFPVNTIVPNHGWFWTNLLVNTVILSLVYILTRIFSSLVKRP